MRVDWRRVRTIALWALALLAVVYFASRIPRTVSIFLIAWFIALGVNPIVKLLEHRGINRVAAIAIVYVVLLGGTTITMLLIVPAAVTQLQSVAAYAPDYVQTAQSLADRVQHRFGKSILPSGYASLNDYIAGSLGGALTGVVTAAGGPILIGTLNALFVGFSAIILSVFFLNNGRGIARSILQLVPPDRRHEVRVLADEVLHIFGGYVSGEAILCAITGLLIGLVCALIGCKFAVLIGVVCGLAYAIPFVGMLAAQIIGAVLAIPQGPSMVLWVSVVIFVVARISDGVLVPKILGPSVGVSPIGVMFAVFAGGELFGTPGLLLGIPAAALTKVLWRIFVSPRIEQHNADVAQRLQDEHEPVVAVTSTTTNVETLISS